MEPAPATFPGVPRRWWQLTVRVPAERGGWATDVIWRHGPAAVREMEHDQTAVVLEAGFEGGEAADTAARELGAAGAWVDLQVVGDERWLDEWRRHARSVVIADRIVVVPAWLAPGAGATTLQTVRLDPGRTFGHGGHPTTVLAVEGMLPYVTTASTVLDVGSGSGVVAIAALVSGAAEATAVDIDPDAVEVTRSNAALNHVEDRLTAIVGGLDQVAARYDLVVANIGAGALIGLAAEVAQHTRSGGRVVLGGFLADRCAEVEGAYRACGYSVLLEQRAEGWAGLVLGRRRPRPRRLIRPARPRGA
ncbi:MAG TPA: 50S ribosomal protein L11 methyltransferase [Acidimicrobiales bacterium]|jgi:ribosomal protein L11 methyltransferase|nr:50S ribosomal protein L11 methyltransferase [Acidimicrobiales bacterium]